LQAKLYRRQPACKFLRGHGQDTGDTVTEGCINGRIRAVSINCLIVASCWGERLHHRGPDPRERRRCERWSHRLALAKRDSCLQGDIHLFARLQA
jgi:hypothetical protein